MSLPHAYSARDRPHPAWWPAALLLIAVLLAYANSFSGPFVFDDAPAVAAAKRLLGLEPLAATPAAFDAGETTSGRPLLLLSFALNVLLSGDAVGSYHALNLLLHASTTLLLFGVLRRSLHRPRGQGGLAETPARWLATLTAGLWALHPLQTAAVTYLAQRAEVLASLWLLAALYAFIRAHVSPARSTLWLTASVAACLLGVASKEVAAVTPIVIALYDLTFVSRSWRTLWRERRGYYLSLAATWGLQAFLVASTSGRGGTAGFDSGVSVASYALTQCGAILRYLGLAIWPSPLVFDYGTAVTRDITSALLPALVLLVAAGFALRGLRRRSAVGFLGCTFFVLLAPSSSVVPIASQTIAEHRFYLALALPVVALVLTLHAIRPAALRLLAGVAVAFLALTHARNDVYRSELRLWQDTVAKRPENPRAHHNLALAELRRGQTAAAEQHLLTAARLDPAVADVHYHLGLVASRLQRPADAVRHYERALALSPSHAEASNNLGAALLLLGRSADAIPRFRGALTRRPAFADAHRNLAEALLREQQPALALTHSLEAVRLRAADPEALFTAGNACAALGRFAEARGHFEAALRSAPDDARVHNNLGNILLQLDQPEPALAHYERALALQPSFLDPRRNLALALLTLGRLPAAQQHLEAWVRERPDDLQAAEALRRVRAELRR